MNLWTHLANALLVIGIVCLFAAWGAAAWVFGRPTDCIFPTATQIYEAP